MVFSSNLKFQRPSDSTEWTRASRCPCSSSDIWQPDSRSQAGERSGTTSASYRWPSHREILRLITALVRSALCFGRRESREAILADIIQDSPGPPSRRGDVTRAMAPSDDGIWGWTVVSLSIWAGIGCDSERDRTHDR